jgi:putative nucleotidyltransferase with HDIG domain
LSGQDLIAITKKVESFPCMPAAASRLLEIAEDPDCEAAQIERILRTDPGLTANVLKLTNSAYYGLKSRVGSIRQAVVLLGIKRLVQVVIASCLKGLMNKPLDGYDLPSGELWRHAIASSIIAEGLVSELKLPVKDDVFTAALVHDLGKLILGRYVKREWETIEEIVERGIPFQMAEHMVLGTDHAEVGSKLLANWAFPLEIVNAVRWHHDPDAAPESHVLIDIVHITDVICLMTGTGMGREGLSYEPSRAVCSRLGLTHGRVERVASKAIEWVDGLAD